MKSFPTILNVNNKDKFSELNYNRILCYLRRELYEHIIREEETNYFELDKFQKKYSLELKNREKMGETVMSELCKIGWKCKLSFGGTGLFIYSSENPPTNCWEDGL